MSTRPRARLGKVEATGGPLLPRPALRGGRDERSSLLEGWGEGLLPRILLAESPPPPDFSLRVKSDLSPQAGRGGPNIRADSTQHHHAPETINW